MQLESESVKGSDYDSPSWAYLQAHKNGRVEAFKQILDILDFDQK